MTNTTGTCLHDVGWLIKNGHRHCVACDLNLGPEITERTPMVPYIAGRRGALVRGIHLCTGLDGEAIVSAMVRDGILVEFLSEWREKT